MKISTNVFASVVTYLSGFGSWESAVLFTPLNDGLVMASVNGEDSFGQYLFKPEEPLEYRFAARIDVLKRISSVATGESIKYKLGSQALFECGGAQWWIPFFNIDQIETRPEIEPEGHIEWGGDFCKWLSLMKFSTKITDEQGCLDCIYINVNCHREEIFGSEEYEAKAFRQGKRLMVSTDGKVMSVYQDSLDEYNFVGKILIERRHVAAICATCESGAKVSIRIGLNHFSVECGRRTAVFGRRRGIFPKKWIDIFKSAKEGTTVGTVETDRHYLGAVVRQVSVVDDAVNLSPMDDGLVLRCVHGESKSAVEMDAKAKGHFGPVNMRSEYLKQIATNWPTDNVLFEYRGAGPIVVRTPKSREFTTLFQPISERVCNVEKQRDDASPGGVLAPVSNESSGIP